MWFDGNRDRSMVADVLLVLFDGREERSTLDVQLGECPCWGSYVYMIQFVKRVACSVKVRKIFIS
jgi:hypothetical protein